APVGWLILLDEVPDEAAMRVACRALVRRHAGLRALPYATAGDVSAAALCNGAAPRLLALRAVLGGHGRGLCRRAAEGLRAAWPTVRVLPPDGAGGDGVAGIPVLGQCGGWLAPGVEEAHFEWHRFDTEADMRHAAFMRARTRGFKLPASIAVLVLNASGRTDDAVRAGSASGDAAYLHVSVNHAVTDAAAIVPLVADLLELHRVALAAGVARPGGQGRASLDAAAVAALDAAGLPPVPSGLKGHVSDAAATPCRPSSTAGPELTDKWAPPDVDA
ncbi:unnamed protein product, partial [Prorocentrum cordatum]